MITISQIDVKVNTYLEAMDQIWSLWVCCPGSRPILLALQVSLKQLKMEEVNASYF
jgi:hypothetical protein